MSVYASHQHWGRLCMIHSSCGCIELCAVININLLYICDESSICSHVLSLSTYDRKTKKIVLSSILIHNCLKANHANWSVRMRWKRGQTMSNALCLCYICFAVITWDGDFGLSWSAFSMYSIVWNGTGWHPDHRSPVTSTATLSQFVPDTGNI